MNIREFKCVQTLTDLVENYGVIGIKTSFEDEGATFEEVMRLKEICNQSNTKLNLKIGGPEAIRDIIDSTYIGVKGIVGPMVESSFGLNKFIKACQNNLLEDVYKVTNLYINVETITAAQNIDSFVNDPSFKELHGVTIGRVDLVGSMGKNRDYVDSDEVLKLARNVFSKVKDKGVKACIGGAVSVNSEDFLKKLHSERLLDKFETRYVIFDPTVALKNLPKALMRAQIFEYEWMMAKQENHLKLANREIKRIQMIQDRINNSTKNV
jgi:hypothetical protein